MKIRTRYDVIPEDAYEFVAVGPSMLVPEAQGMQQLMLYRASPQATRRAQVKIYPAPRRMVTHLRCTPKTIQSKVVRA
jgi:hypothetical protein